jgi:hypothetical protein
MSTEHEELYLIERLRAACLVKLRSNSHKKHWKTLSNQQLLRLLKKEVSELETCINKGTESGAWYEAGNVANFAAMIADNLNNPTQKPEVDEEVACMSDIDFGEEIDPEAFLSKYGHHGCYEMARLLKKAANDDYEAALKVKYTNLNKRSK